MVGEERPRTAGGVAGEQEPAEVGHGVTPVHAAVQLHCRAQHEELDCLQEPVLQAAALEHPLTRPLPREGAARLRCQLPLDTETCQSTTQRQVTLQQNNTEDCGTQEARVWLDTHKSP